MLGVHPRIVWSRDVPIYFLLQPQMKQAQSLPRWFVQIR